jgi:uncharacterized membrane protein (GlpM family)
MAEDKQLTELESLRIIAEMIQKTKNEFYETGISALLWGSVVGFCGLYAFAAFTFDWPFKNEVWVLTFIAIVPQIIIAVREQKLRRAKQYIDGVGAVWIAFAVTMIGMTFFTSTIPNTVAQNFKEEHLELLLHNTQKNTTDSIAPFFPNFSSVYLLVYAFPTLVTGIGRRFKPMIYGAVVCYICFIISCFTANHVDLLLQSIAAVSCWLIPGLILHNRYRKAKASNV